MESFDSRNSQFIQVASFVGFYLSVEYLFWSHVSILHIPTIEAIVLLLISFLNLIPAGIFSFMVSSLLPVRLASSYNETNISKLNPILSGQRIALVYTTYNDFMSDHAEYDYAEARKGGYSFFLLDDSTDQAVKRQIDLFADNHRCSVLRRSGRKGYKAGAINNWVDKLGSNYDYFFILDSDSRASRAAIQYCIDLASRDPSLAVIQTKTLTMTSTPTRLTRSAVTVQHAYMEIVQKAMKNLGTSPYYGHNALIKVKALNSVGGFVGESNEDYKTLARLHHNGYRSIYAEKAVTWEEVPPDYISSRKRSLRWSRDAVSQMSLLKYGGPAPVGFFLFYGWVTHMSNLALTFLLPILTLASLPGLFNNSFATIAGSVTLSVIILWPVLAVRIKDPELTLRKMGTSLFWGSAYNIPMMAPVTAQIMKTIASRTWINFQKLFGRRKQVEEEFFVTPKTTKIERSLISIMSKLKAELVLGAGVLVCVLFSGHIISILFASPQLLSVASLPLLIYYESIAKNRSLKQQSPYYSPYVRYEKLPSPAIQRLTIR